ncbi:Methyltransferase type 11 [Pleurostoma richardsiae]|uniref:Methyltransferase type 11 n=1 Tax=Pleurostoma richardsiae TaxID=41990 RepID=A0AA38RDP3_9PEZI|nr:Methyltransferase type 11 [Pleurostoma richardsiae]
MAATFSETETLVNPNPGLQSYYASLESRIGYRIFLGDTRHFGYYESAASFPLPIGRSLRRMEEKLLGVLGLPAGSHILDAGCGVGHVALYMARHGMRMTAIDIVHSHIKKAKRNVARSGLPSGQVTVQKMDYHHLESISDASYDGIYTMEALVHATDPEAVLVGFHRILRPGGRIVLFEYDHIPDDAGAPEDLSQSMKQISAYTAMPTNTRATPGLYNRWLEDAGFESVVVRDYSENILPMLKIFWVLALVPYFLVKLFHMEKYFINTVAGYQAYRGHQFWRYVAVTATKPDASMEGSKTKCQDGNDFRWTQPEE